jgi:hypothetical protein
LGWPEAVTSLSGDLQGFDAEEGGTFALEAITALQADLEKGRPPRQAAARAAAEFRRMCRLFDVVLDPIPFA